VVEPPVVRADVIVGTGTVVTVGRAGAQRSAAIV